MSEHSYAPGPIVHVESPKFLTREQMLRIEALQQAVKYHTPPFSNTRDDVAASAERFYLFLSKSGS